MKYLIYTFVFLIFISSAEARKNWIKKDICKKKKDKVELCKHVGKSLYLGAREIGPVVGVVYLKKGQNRGTNQKRSAEKTGYYLLINDMGDMKNLITSPFTSDHFFSD